MKRILFLGSFLVAAALSQQSVAENFKVSTKLMPKKDIAFGNKSILKVRSRERFCKQLWKIKLAPQVSFTSKTMTVVCNEGGCLMM
jgi:hypothetical protein